MVDQLIQGYVPTLTNAGKTRFVDFVGGLTEDWEASCVCLSVDDAFKTARRLAKSLNDLPGAIAIGKNAGPLAANT